VSVCESDIVNRSCGRHSLGARPLGHSMRVVRESTARKRRIIATEQSPAVSRCVRMSQEVLRNHLRRSLFRPFCERCNSYERSNRTQEPNTQNLHNNATLR